MSNYIEPTELTDPTFDVTETHCLAADDYVNSKLWEKGINPQEVTLPSKLLSRIAGYWAKREAAIEGAIGEDSPLLRKATEFEKNAEKMANTIGKKSLGITSAGTFGATTVLRG